MIAKTNLNPYSKYMQQGFGKIQLLLIILLLIAVGIGIYLTSRPQVYRSKAGTSSFDSGWVNNLEMTDQNGNKIVCNTNLNPPECTTDTPIINIRVNNTSLIPRL